MKKRLHSFSYAFKGIWISLKQPNMRIHIIVACLVVATGLLLSLSPTEWLAISLVIGLVLVCEIINTAIEHLVDMIAPEFNSRAGTVKDLAAGSVLVAATCAVVIAALIFVPKLVERIS